MGTALLLLLGFLQDEWLSKKYTEALNGQTGNTTRDDTFVRVGLRHPARHAGQDTPRKVIGPRLAIRRVMR
jgi:hypothetical protein